jgi:hypothetical protein
MPKLAMILGESEPEIQFFGCSVPLSSPRASLGYHGASILSSGDRNLGLVLVLRL